MQTENVVFCIQCGMKLPAEAKFCFRCGSTLPAAEASKGDASMSENIEAATEQQDEQEYDAAVSTEEVQQETNEAEQADIPIAEPPPQRLDWNSIVLTPEEEAGLTSRQKRELKRRKARELQRQQEESAKGEEIAPEQENVMDATEDHASQPVHAYEEAVEQDASYSEPEEAVYEFETEVHEEGFSSDDDSATVINEPPEVRQARKVLEQFGVQSSSMHGQFFFAPVIVSNNATLMELIQRCTIIPQTPQDERLIAAIKTMPPYKAQQIELMDGWINSFGGQLLMGDLPHQQPEEQQGSKDMAQDGAPQATTLLHKAEHAVTQKPKIEDDKHKTAEARKPMVEKPAPPPPPPPTPKAPDRITPASPNAQRATPVQQKPVQQQTQTRPQPSKPPVQRQSPPVNKPGTGQPHQRSTAPGPHHPRPNAQPPTSNERKFQGRAKKEKPKPVEDEEEEYNYYDGMAEDDGRDRKDIGSKDDRKTTIIKMAAVLVGTGIIMWLMLSVLPNLL